MAHNPQAPRNTQHDPAGSTQMFQAFVDEAPAGTSGATSSGGNRGLVIGALVAVAVIAVVLVAVFAL
ncbi:hypothetical protein [Streptomyces lonarensis]|uniref:Uncharacterized protein n=1 Tax=Streptomyces lonarensis TaxID=700599 RepID=A0A7X6HY70_9ACTN|nr:hypothetical protein [Streptomyces lonarensis]NJQ05278.1 hypothetical protein [Streptomyces lonarensis]